MKRGRALFPALLLGALATCDGGPKAGEIVFSLATPNQDDGAIQFTVRAVAPATLVSVAAACAPCEVFTQAVDDAEIRGVLTGSVVAGPALRVTVSDRRAEAYTAAVVAAAARSYQLRSTAGYALGREP